jgi:prepilin-type N-terminal cleavage/methylation domain-containing protein
MDEVKKPGASIRSEKGFGLIEMMIAISVLGIGLLGMAAMFTEGLLQVATGQSDNIAKQKASEAIESVFAARDTRLITWAQIRNVSNGGVFLNGAQTIKNSGADGLVNTADDGAVESILVPGPDAQFGTADDVSRPLSLFTREIEITDLGVNLRRIRAIVRYRVGRLNKECVLVTYISSFA